ncbi:MAG: recombination protein O N-terminal domain-containing protein [Planctomycetota bacterium]|nr:recombination protein O N-terminal domain-containing protein [Planctomycetota bacterium]
MPILKDLAVVLRTYEVSNTSLVLVLLGRRLGQVRVLAKGARRFHKKGFEGGFDLLAQGEVVAYPRRGEALWILKEWDERSRAAGLGRGARELWAASYLCELAEALTREGAGSSGEDGAGGDEAPARLHGLLGRAARALESGASPGATLLWFTLHALESAGLLPELGACSRCGKELARSRRPARLNAEGLVCEGCLAGEALERLPVGAAPPGTVAELARLLEAAPGTRRAGAVWLTPELLGALRHIQRTGKPVKLSAGAARAGARALLALVHNALERDLRTLRAAAKMVVEMK